MNANDCLSLIQARQSTALLTDPAPSPAQIRQLIAAAICAPDHHVLRPWRFIEVRGEARNTLASYMVEAAIDDDARTEPSVLERIATLPLRAPLLLVAYATIEDHPKVPRIERVLSLGAAIQNLLLQVQAQGYAAMWRTGDMAFSGALKERMGLTVDDAVGGFIYIGTAQKPSKPRVLLNTDDFIKLLK